ncbi:MAG TPA: VOC family protein [Longimicrobiales bacterium]|nr:VOC family protein [Longimicrobiales bacterium]
MQKITTCLWFDGQAEDAATFYGSIFPDSKILSVARNHDGSALMVKFQLHGQEFLGLNGGPQFSFTEAMSLVVDCEDQAEVDTLWARLTEGGEESMCGWLKDRYGVSWQIVPRALPELLQHPDPATATRVMNAMLQMRKIDVARLREAAEQRAGTAEAPLTR